MSARIITLPTAATEPVRQPPKRAGRHPKIVTNIHHGKSIKISAGLKAEAITDAKTVLKEAEDFYRVCKRIHDSALNALLGAQQRVNQQNKNGGGA